MTSAITRVGTRRRPVQALALFVGGVFLLFGAAGVLAASSTGASRLFLAAGGFVYLLLWVYGAAVHSTDHDGDPANFAPFNSADNLLHLGLGAGMVLLAVLATVAERAQGRYPGREQRGA
ncbi:DUF4383 domain-containing protein [Actinosynnema sp. NPDC023658]|uniref:DUF4383 domain-containing protein n=1 Tax=Actinosynnema sp. NPDC023658 TaxID=3155465 RepID=UPI0033D2D751